MSKLALVVLVTAVLAAPLGAAPAGWVVIGSAKTSGPFTVASARGDVSRPKDLQLRTQGKYTGGKVTVVYSCKRVIFTNRSDSAPVTLEVPGSESCNVIATGSIRTGTMTVKIEALK